MTSAATPIELRVYLPIAGLQPQFAAYLGTPTRARGYPPLEGDHALIVEVAPGLAVERITDLALRAEPAVEPGILFVERHFGILEVHARGADEVARAGQAILDGIGQLAADQLRPRMMYADVIEDITDQQAVVINRSRQASMIMPGQSLLVCEMAPALFAAVAANEAEKAAPQNTLVDVTMIGASGRLYLAGSTEGVLRSQAAIEQLLSGVEGRDQ
jgi:GAF domain-containing protein